MNLAMPPPPGRVGLERVLDVGGWVDTFENATSI